MVRLRAESRRLLFPLILACLVAPLVASGGDFWDKKPYQNWTADETNRVLEESPWATTLKLRGVQTNISSADGANNYHYRGEMETDPFISYTLQFRSAEPIRQAQVRSSQLSVHYDKMNPDQKAAFDANATKFLAATFPDRVVVSVTFHTNVQDYESELRSYWTTRSLAKLSMSVFLNTKTERLSLTSYSFNDDTFQFTFPRPKQVQPDEKVSVEFVHPRVNVITQQRVLQEFSLKKMLRNGEPVF